VDRVTQCFRDHREATLSATEQGFTTLCFGASLGRAPSSVTAPNNLGSVSLL
jgi:hypothetical protein